MTIMYTGTKNRIDWIDVCKAIAIFFIYCGHWLTKSGNLEVFAYSFHLQLFFILSGFFAINQQKKSCMQFIRRQFNLTIIPFIFFTVLNIIYFNLDGKKTLTELLLNFFTNFTDFSHSVSSELWFLTALFCVSVSYYFLARLIKKPLILLIISYILYIIQVCFKDTFLGFVLYPFIKFMGISSVPRYLFWYSLGAFLFPYIKRAINIIDSEKSYKKYTYLMISVFLFLITLLIYFFKPDAFWEKLIIATQSNKAVNNTFVYNNFKIAIALIISLSFVFISYIFRYSRFLSLIGKNTLILLGFETIMKNYLVLKFIPMFNLGIIKLETTAQVLTISLLTLLCIVPLFKPLNMHIPFLLGKKNDNKK